MMKHRFLLATVVFLLCATGKAKDNCTIPMAVAVENGVPENVKSLLSSKLRNAVTKNGLDGDVKKAYFTLVASTEETGKEVVSGLRPVVTTTLDLHLYVKNNFTGEKFSATSISLSGAGRNDATARRAAISNLANQERPIQLFLQETKRKIDEYYHSQMSLIVSQAETMATQNKFEEALFLLSTVPTCCEKYDKAEKAMLKIFQQYIDYDCAQKLAKAQNVWNATQNREGAKVAGAYLAAIDPASDCSGEVKELCKTINERIGEEWEFAKELQRDSVKHEELRIKAIKTIGKAMADELTEPTPKQQEKQEEQQKEEQQNGKADEE